MSNLVFTFLLAIGLGAITTVADILIKSASLQKSFSGWKLLLLGGIIYGLTAFGWFFVMRKIKLSTLGVCYSMSCIIILTLTSVFYFKEKINAMEIFGICLAIASLLILARFA